MSSIANRWIQAHRLSRAVFVAVALAGVLLWSLWNTPAPLVSRTTVTGEVVSVVKDGIMVIALPDGRQARVFTPNPAPAVGERIPMTVETYEDGSVTAVIDVQTWKGVPR